MVSPGQGGCNPPRAPLGGADARGHRAPESLMNTVHFLLLAVIVQADSSASGPAGVPEPDSTAAGWFSLDSIPGDTYLDPGVRDILRLALSQRDEAYEGIESYEGTMAERVYAGMGGWRFRRERGLFTQERVARIRWERGGDRVVQWIGARRSVPLLGDNEELQREVNQSLDEDLIDEGDPPALYFNPWDRRIVFGEESARHPLSDSAAFYYRYGSGDTLRLTLPDRSRTITMVEVRVRPRFTDVDLVAGSLWFDRDTGALVRGTFKPARPWNLEVDAEDDEDAGDVPGFLKPIEAEVEYVTVDYSLHELRYWLPRRFGAEAELRIGRFLNFPVLFEWTVSGYRVNEASSDIPLTGPVPPGWTRAETRVEREGEGPYYVTVLVPSADSLVASPSLPDPVVSSESQAFTTAEIAQIRDDLDQLVGGRWLFGPRIAYGLQDGMLRYNRIEALSAGVSAELPVSADISAYMMGRVGFDLEPNGELSLQLGREERRWALTGFRRLAPTNDWENPAHRLLNVVDGQDDGQYYRTLGGEVSHVRAGRRTRVRLRAFYEHQTSAEKLTDVYLFRPLGGELPENIAAEPGDVFGAGVTVQWQAGIDPRGWVASGFVAAEGGAGDFGYQRVAGSIALTRPLFWHMAAAVEGQAGASFSAPPQRRFSVGGIRTARGFRTGTRFGESFWTSRAELANDFPAFRILVFGDFGWAGDRDRFLAAEDWLASVGLGFSILDGLARFDLAKAVRGGSDFRLHLYLDGLF